MMAVAAKKGLVYLSDNYGNHWTKRMLSVNNYTSLAFSADGKMLAVITSNENPSSHSGEVFIGRYSEGEWS